MSSENQKLQLSETPLIHSLACSDTKESITKWMAKESGSQQRGDSEASLLETGGVMAQVIVLIILTVAFVI